MGDEYTTQSWSCAASDGTWSRLFSCSSTWKGWGRLTSALPVVFSPIPFAMQHGAHVWRSFSRGLSSAGFTEAWNASSRLGTFDAWRSSSRGLSGAQFSEAYITLTELGTSCGCTVIASQ